MKLKNSLTVNYACVLNGKRKNQGYKKSVISDEM